jgi:hypothetical protein
MKRNIFIISTLIALVSISAFTYRRLNSTKKNHLNAENPKSSVFFNKYLYETLDNFIYYDLDSRFNISKDKLSNSTAFLDSYSKLAGEIPENITSVSIAKLKEDMSTINIENCDNSTLKESQIELLKSLEYKDNLLLKIVIKKENVNSGKMVNRLLTFNLRVVPEKEAEYSLGKKAFIDFIRENTIIETLNIKKKELDSGRISFIVLRNGEVSNVKLNYESGLKKLDDKVIKLLNNLPEKWKPAQNAKGEAIDQELVFSFGNQGC